MSEERIVIIKNVSSAKVCLYIPAQNFKRELKGEGTSTRIPFDVLYEGLLSEPGIGVLFDEGYLYIENQQDRIDLGLEEEDLDGKNENKSPKVMESKDILALLKENNPTKLKTALSGLALEQKKKFVSVAVENDIYSAGLAHLIKEATGMDLLKAIQQKHEEEKE